VLQWVKVTVADAFSLGQGECRLFATLTNKVLGRLCVILPYHSQPAVNVKCVTDKVKLGQNARYYPSSLSFVITLTF